MNAMISVGLPAYKTEFLERSIESILNQTYSDFELIIVDDHSPEDVKGIVNQFNDDRIRYFRNEKNLGMPYLTDNWNECLKYANGEYFVLFSDDDIYEPDFLEELMLLATKYPNTELFHCRVAVINEDDEVINLSPLCPEYESGLDFIWHRVNGKRLQFAPDFMCRTEKLREIGGFHEIPLAWGSDDITWFKIAVNSNVAYSSKVLCAWRLSEFNISSSGNINVRLNAIQQYQEWFVTFLKQINVNDESEKFMVNQMTLNLKKNFTQKKMHLIDLGFQSNKVIRLIKFISMKNKYNIGILRIMRSFFMSLIRK
jgi:glycosyltransferase involved in cell wall biosynthesis